MLSPGTERAIVRLSDTMPGFVKVMMEFKTVIAQLLKLKELELKQANDLVNVVAVPEPYPQDPEKCSCDGKGWDFFQENDGLIRLESCDSCDLMKHDDDIAEVLILLNKFAGRVLKDPPGDYSKARYNEDGSSNM